MGKSNRIRNDRANTTAPGIKTPKKKNGMPSWAINLITILVAAVILLSVVFSLLTANGVFGRMQTAMKTENFRVSGNMMKYYFNTQYQNFISQNSSYLSSLGLDTGKSLKEQSVNLGEESQTWFDYMMDMTEAQVENMLVWCEEAEQRGIALNDEELESIEAELSNFDTYAKMYGYTTDSYIATIFGKGVKEKDVRKCLELSALASKCGTEVGKELESKITDGDIDGEYAENQLDYDLVDMMTYTYSVTYSEAKSAAGEDATEEQIIAKYKELIAKAKEDAAALEKSESIDAFKAIIIADIVDGVYDDEYDAAEADSEVVADDKPSDLDAVREKIIAHISELLKTDKEFVADDIVTEGKLFGEIEISVAYTSFIKETAAAVYSSSKEALDSATSEGTSYTDSDESVEWAFGDERKEADKDTFESGDSADGAELSDKASELKSFSAKVVYLTKTRYKNAEATKNVGIMTFTSTETAASAIAKLTQGMSIEDFEAIAEEFGGSFTKYENYQKGALGVAAFDTWLYGEGAQIGSYTSTYVSADETSFIVALNYADGEPEWWVTVKNSIYSDRYSEFSTELADKYEVTVNEKVVAKIDG